MEKQVFESLKRGLQEAKSYKEGKLVVYPLTVKIKIPNVKKIRKRTGLTQEEFAKLFGWSKDAVASWEQGRRAPEHSARALLRIIDRDPEFVLDVLRA